jgi:hypothetical protein
MNERTLESTFLSILTGHFSFLFYRYEPKLMYIAKPMLNFGDEKCRERMPSSLEVITRILWAG